VDLLAFEVDYPHSDSVWPDAPEFLLAQLEGAGMSDADIDKVTWGNVARFCSYDPFTVIPKEQATVGALRARATDVEIADALQGVARRYEANLPFVIPAG
jgi:hypothetical protein